eukprot:TRINITY_DN19344_c0_g1_i1.p1 TRINITY_DN19344_c0_g1~~TRINITY_DN19344_c0_g1_i1.p1  ORF type:complete len:274 (-),score=56.57 TRINITY_DN19344_c0_g1_i1:579-1400(-)
MATPIPPPSYVTIEVENLDPSILLITLNKPSKKNAIDWQTYSEMVDALDGSVVDPKVQAVILTGSGDYFTSGADLSESKMTHHRRGMMDPETAPVGRFMKRLLTFPKLLIAAVNGPAVGIGVTLLCHCDFAFAAPSATFWTPFVRVAVVPEFCSSVTFPRIFGPSLANEMLLMGRLLSVEEAQGAGLISSIFPQESFLEDVVQKIRDMLDQPLAKQSLPLFKAMIKKPFADELERVFKDEMVELGKRSMNGDTGEAVRIAMGSKKSGGATSKL